MFSSAYLTPEQIDALYQRAFQLHETRRLQHHINKVLMDGDTGEHDEALDVLARLEADYVSPFAAAPEGPHDGSGS